ncbi:response regulator transcription factor [Streptomyces sp. MspMP-M5]|uniref:response regulator transcription factor n=1 Tax=unclassified Streptomyces TaxID=2593676 RepID=UPI00037FFC81|nr:response regulator transcription factor [Streptomyces sp. MspMP-M5]MYT32511.1 response regulator [Streptomyces sp. SID8354]
MINVAIVEDQAMLRSAIVALLELEPDIKVVSQLGRGDTAVETLAGTGCDVLLLDVEMPGVSGLDVAEALKHHPHPPLVMMLTTFQRPGYVRRALEAGARAYLTKDSSVGEIAAAIRRVAAGELLFSGQQIRLAMESGDSPLSKRERDVLRAAQFHDTLADIAEYLHLSVSTVSNYITAAIAKTTSRNRAQAIRVARDRGWL